MVYSLERLIYSLGMTVKKALSELKNGKSILVGGKEVVPEQLEYLKLEDGEEVLWVRTEGNLWLSIDAVSDEVFFFQDLDESLEDGEDSVLYNGSDYEFSSGGSGEMQDEEGEELDKVSFRDYESGSAVIRIVSYEVTGDHISSVGHRVTEEELQAV